MKTVFISGASSGIGRAAAQLFADNGWNVVAAMLPADNGNTLDSQKNILPVYCDVKNAETVKHAIELALKTFGTIDVLVNNAGVYNTKPLESMSDGEIDDILNTNLKGVIACTQAVLPHFRKNRAGTLINISSMAGFAAFPFQTLYHASKWGLEGLSESLQYELKPFNIKVKIVEPGVVKTPLYDKLKGIDHSIHTDYLDNFSASYQTLLKNIRKGLSPDISARTIYQAATDDSWTIRYRSGPDTKLVALLRTLLPLSAFMRLIEKMTGLRQTPRQSASR